MQLEIIPYTSIGPIKFGMTRNEVQSVLGSSAKSFMKTPQSKWRTDAYTALGIHVYFKESDLVEAVEIFLPAMPIFMKHDLLKIPTSEIVEIFRSSDCKIENNGDITFFDFGIGLYCNGEEKTMAPKTVICFEKKYYD